jgi:hypothetical protein
MNLTEEQIEDQRKRFNAMQRDGWDMDYPIALCDMALEYLKVKEDAERLNYWAEHAAGEFLYDATDHSFVKFLPKKPPRHADQVKAALDAARKGGSMTTQHEGQTPRTPCRHGMSSAAICEICAEVIPLEREIANLRQQLEVAKEVAKVEADNGEYWATYYRNWCSTDTVSKLIVLEDKLATAEARTVERCAKIAYRERNELTAAARIAIKENRGVTANLLYGKADTALRIGESLQATLKGNSNEQG